VERDVDVFAVIMAGGSGTRFWPASRNSRPKQFLKVAGSRSLLRATFDRLVGVVPPERVLVVGGQTHEALLRAELPDVPGANLLLEPTGRNTLPCVALAALEVGRRAPDSVQVVLPADHVIAPEEAFHRTLERAVEAAARERALVTFGIRPTHPATGYGYIELDGAAPAPDTAVRVKRFVEKPDRERASEFLASGRYLWNSGIFVWRTATILEELRRHAPATLGALQAAGADWPEAYSGLEAVSIDVGLMERAEDVRVLAVDYTWSDVGSWAALPDVLGTDAEGNCEVGTRLVSIDSRDCVVYGPGESTTALIGVEGLVVVQSGDAVLVCPRERAEEVRRVVERLREEAPREP